MLPELPLAVYSHDAFIPSKSFLRWILVRRFPKVNSQLPLKGKELMIDLCWKTFGKVLFSKKYDKISETNAFFSLTLMHCSAMAFDAAIT